MKLARARLAIKRWGFAAFVYDCLMSVLQPWLRLCVVQVRPLRSDASHGKLAARRSLRRASTSELLEASADPQLDLKAEWIKRAEARGEICLAVFEEGSIIAYLWRAFGPTPHMDGLWVHFDSRLSYSFKGFTRPEHRRQRLQQALSYALDDWLLDQGYSHSIRFVESHNYPSLTNRPDQRTVGYAGYLRLFGRVIPFRSPGARRYGFAFRPAGDHRPGQQLGSSIG